MDGAKNVQAECGQHPRTKIALCFVRIVTFIDFTRILSFISSAPKIALFKYDGCLLPRYSKEIWSEVCLTQNGFPISAPKKL